MKRNVLWIAALATTMMTSCIYDNENDPTVVQQQGQYSNDEVKIMASMGGTASTRATSNLQSDNLNNWSTAGIFVYRTGKTGPDNTAPSYVGYSNVTITSPTTSTAPSASSLLTLTPSKPLYFPSNNTNVDVYVYAPYASAYDYNSSTNLNPVTAMAFTVNADQSTDANYIASDFVYGKGMADYNTDKTAKVTMYHALTKLTFKIEDVGGIAGNIEEIDLLDVYKKATIDMSIAPNGTAPWLTAGTHVTTSPADGDKGDVKVAAVTTTTDLYTKLVKPATGTCEGVSVVIPAQSGMSDSAGPKVKVKIGSNEKENYLGSASLNAFQPGYEYVYTLKIKSEEVIVTVVSIKPWELGADQERDLQF